MSYFQCLLIPLIDIDRAYIFEILNRKFVHQSHAIARNTKLTDHQSHAISGNTKLTDWMFVNFFELVALVLEFHYIGNLPYLFGELLSEIKSKLENFVGNWVLNKFGISELISEFGISVLLGLLGHSFTILETYCTYFVSF